MAGILEAAVASLRAIAVAVGVAAWCVGRGVWLSFYYLVHPHPEYREHLL